jgi:hypothetical protein
MMTPSYRTRAPERFPCCMARQLVLLMAEATGDGLSSAPHRRLVGRDLAELADQSTTQGAAAPANISPKTISVARFVHVETFQ